MDEMYGLNSMAEYSDNYKTLLYPENLILPAADYYQNLFSSASTTTLRDNCVPIFGSDEPFSAASEAASIAPEIQREEDISSMIKAKIASHPCYPRLLQAYIDCQKVNNNDLLSSFLVQKPAAVASSSAGYISTQNI